MTNCCSTSSWISSS